MKQIEESDWKPDVIVGIVRGGAVPAVALSHRFNVPCVTFRLSFRDFDAQDDMSHIFDWAGVFGRKVLVVDDINDTGRTFEYIARSYKTDKRFAALIHNKSSHRRNIPYYGRMIDKSVHDVWVRFPWENRG